MNIKSLVAPVTRFGYRIYGKAAKHSPELPLAGGLIAMTAGTIVACERTTKAEEILDTTHAQLDKVHRATEQTEYEYTKSDRQKDLILIYTRTGVGFAKLYAPAVVLEAAGIAMILGSYGIMRKRNIALTAAYTALENGYSEYRRRVREKLGEEEDLYFKTGLRPKAIEITETDENGNEKKVITEQKVFDPDHANVSKFARWFDETNINFTTSPYNNLSFLKSVQHQAERMLHRDGFIFLNDVYDLLGFDRVPQGQAVGWMLNGETEGQGYIDFGIYDGYRQSTRDFVNGYEKAILLDFNIDPIPIWDKI